MTLVFHYNGRVEKGFQLSVSNAFFNQYITPAMFRAHKAELKGPSELMSWIFMNKIMPVIMDSKTRRLLQIKATYDNTGGGLERPLLSHSAPVLPRGIVDKYHSNLVSSRAVFPPAELQDMINKAISFCGTSANRGCTKPARLPYPPNSSSSIEDDHVTRSPSKMASQSKVASSASAMRFSPGPSRLESSKTRVAKSPSKLTKGLSFSKSTSHPSIHPSIHPATQTNSSVISSGSRIHVLLAFPSTMQPSCMFPSLLYPLNSNPAASREIIKETGESVGGFTGLWVDAFGAVLPPHINLHIRKTLNGSINESSWVRQFEAFHMLFSDSVDGSSTLISSLLNALKIDYSNYKIVRAYEQSLNGLSDDEAEDDESDGIELA